MIKKDSATNGEEDHVRELLEEVKRLHATLLAESRRLGELLAAAGVGPRPAAENDYLERWEQRRRDESQRLAAELIAGPARFRVSHPGDPTLLVGAANGEEAVTKYRRRLGIVGTPYDFTVDDVAGGPATCAGDVCQRESACQAAAS
jgi:hypothetical protein